MMDEKEYLKNYNLEHAISCSTDVCLRDLLFVKESKDLEYHYYILMNKEGLTARKKLVNQISSYLLDVGHLKSIFKNLNETEYKFLMKVIVNDGVLQDDYVKTIPLIYLSATSIITMVKQDDKVYFVIPKDVLEIIKTIDMDKYEEISYQNTKLQNFLDSVLNLYGLVILDDFISMCESMLGLSVDNINWDLVFKEAINPVIVQNIDNGFQELTCLFKGEWVDPGQRYIVENIVNSVSFNNIEYKPIELDKLLKYEDIFYYQDNEYVKDLRKYLKKVCEDDVEETIMTFLHVIKVNYFDIINYVEELTFNESFDADILLEKISRVYNNMPVWGTNGWTIKELINMKIETESE